MNYHTQLMLKYLELKEFNHNCKSEFEFLKLIIELFGYSYQLNSNSEYVETDKVNWHLIFNQTRQN